MKKPEKNTLIFLGDIHGEWSSLARKIEEQSIKNAYIVQVGDFGVGFKHPLNEEAALHRLNECLETNNIDLFAIRGNHDSPKFFATKNHPYNCHNITFLPDYSELEILGKRIFLAGGAVSIDRLWRVEGKSYWSDEAFKFNDQFPFDNREFDIVVTHTRPPESGIFLSKKGIEPFLKADSNLEKDINQENTEMSKLYKKLSHVKEWIFGHFHDSETKFIGETKFKLLNIDEFYEQR